MSNEMRDRLYELRSQAELNQEQLAEKLGVSRQAISKWERGETQPDVGNLIVLSDLYDVSIDYIVKGEGDAPAAIELNVEDESQALEVEPNEDLVIGERITDEEDAQEDEVPCPEVEEETASAYPPPAGQERVEFDSNAAAVDEEPRISGSQEAKKRRSPWMTFPYPLLVVIVFLLLGFAFGAWDPAWVLFLTIPFYYWIASVIVHDPGSVDDQQGR